MRKLFFILLLIPAMVFAAPVDPKMAQQIAENFINTQDVDSVNRQNKTPRKPKHMRYEVKKVAEEQQYYIFNSEDSAGFVIVAADDIAIPILGYSDSDILDVDNMPENLRWWLSEYDREINWAKEQGIEPMEDTRKEWQKLALSRRAKQANVVVSPLIKTEWSQGSWYNSKCPYDSQKGEYCLTGCVATAMAQIMKYWNFPTHGRGNHSYTHNKYGVQYADFEHTTYDWSNMPNDLGLLSSSTAKNAVATLMYHCGVAVEMDYGVDESGAMGFMAENAVKDYFWYSDESRILGKDDYTVSQWRSKLTAQLLCGYPIFYSGGSMLTGGGHAFICDGYRDDYYFHFNWGWDSSDGYYSLTALTPSTGLLSTGNYTSNQSAMVCMYPKRDTIARYSLEMGDIYLSDSIAYGEDWYLIAGIENVGEKEFSGYLYTTVCYMSDLGSILMPTGIAFRDSVRVDSFSGYELFDMYVKSAHTLPVGVYQISLYYKDDNNEINTVKDDYAANSKQITIYHPIEMDLTAGFAWKGSREHWGVGDSIKFITQINNNESTPFTGSLTIKLMNKADSSIYQFFDNRDCIEEPIPAHGDAILSVIGKLTTTPGEYDVYLLYKNNEFEDWKLVGCAEGFVNPMSLVVEPPIERNEYVILAQRKTTTNWYYLTSHNAGTVYTPHLEAINSGTADKDQVQNYGLGYQYIWTIEETNGGVLISNLDGYIAYDSGNTAYMHNASGQVLFVNNLSSGLKQYWFVDGSNETRYLSLNTANDYFSFYKGTQVQDLLVLKYTDGPTTSVDATEQEEPSVTKVIVNGQILILRGEKMYTLTGQEVR